MMIIIVISIHINAITIMLIIAVIIISVLYCQMVTQSIALFLQGKACCSFLSYSSQLFLMVLIEGLENCLPATQDDEQVDRSSVPAHW